VWRFKSRTKRKGVYLDATTRVAMDADLSGAPQSGVRMGPQTSERDHAAVRLGAKHCDRHIARPYSRDPNPRDGIVTLGACAAIIGPKWFTRRRTLSYETAIPCSPGKSSRAFAHTNVSVRPNERTTYIYRCRIKNCSP
jgi:hypothetical protein